MFFVTRVISAIQLIGWVFVILKGLASWIVKTELTITTLVGCSWIPAKSFDQPH